MVRKRVKRLHKQHCHTCLKLIKTYQVITDKPIKLMTMEGTIIFKKHSKFCGQCYLELESIGEN